MQEILIPAACMLLLGLFIAAVVHPILTRKQAWQRATGGRRQLLELTERKEQLYASIKEMEFDHSLGKISRSDYDMVRAGLESEALEVLHRLDTIGAGNLDAQDADLDARIQSDVAALRHSAGDGSVSVAAEEPAAHRFCHSCGKPRTSEHRFCPHCGQSFDPA